MSQRDNFGAGFFLGAVLGGAVGGIIGAIVTNRSQTKTLESTDSALDALEPPEAEISASESVQRRLRSRRRLDEVRMENARRSLEGKIAQLNEAIDDVRQQFEDSGMH